MSVEDWKLQVSFKLGQDMINVRANTADELSVNLEAIAELAPQIVSTQQILGGTTVLAPLSTQHSTPSTAQQPSYGAGFPQSQSATPEGLGPVCAHGPRIHRVGISKTTNRPYDFWACPTPKGTPNQCAPVNG